MSQMDASFILAGFGFMVAVFGLISCADSKTERFQKIGIGAAIFGGCLMLPLIARLLTLALF